MTKKTKVIAIVSNKGGVGKTTTCISLAYGLAREGRKVVFIDVDAQSNGTWTLLHQVFDDGPNTMYDALVNKRQVAEILVSTAHENLYFAPSSTWLTGAETELASVASREYRLALVLRSLIGEVDYILIDTPPNLGVVTQAAIVAATDLLIPAIASPYARIGTELVVKTLAAMRANMEMQQKEFFIFGVLITQINEQLKIAKESKEALQAIYGDLVFDTVIPRNVKIEEASNILEPLFDYAPDSKGAIAYSAFCKEFLAREQQYEQMGRDAYLALTMNVFSSFYSEEASA